MTQQFDALCEGPQTGIDVSNLAAEERVEMRSIDVPDTGARTRSPKTGSPTTGTFTRVFYLVGDEREAAERFVGENRAALEAIPLTESDRNVLAASIDREIYDLILDILGVRELTKYATVVVEHRPEDGYTWCVGRSRFESASSRYVLDAEGAARITGTVAGLVEHVLASHVGVPVGNTVADMDVEEEEAEAEAETETEPETETETEPETETEIEPAAGTSLDDAGLLGPRTPSRTPSRTPARTAGDAPLTKRAGGLRIDASADPVLLTESTLRECDRVRGDVREVLDAIRQDPAFRTIPVSVDGELGLEIDVR